MSAWRVATQLNLRRSPADSGTLGIRVEGGWSGGWGDKLNHASGPPSLSPTCIVMECSDKDTECLGLYYVEEPKTV